MKNISIFSFFTTLLLLALVAGGCSDRNSVAPPPGQVHPAGWGSTHAAEARTRLADCQLCHGLNFAGNAAAVSCFSCHPSGPPFNLHPGGWVDVVADHQSFAQDISWTTCATAICHGPTLEGGSSGPSCFNVVCHETGEHGASGHGIAGHPPAPASHRPGPFANPENHGPAARLGQFACHNCHGRPENDFNGGFVADLFTAPAKSEIDLFGNCSLCHLSAKAHPTRWQGSNDADPLFYAASHRGIDATAQERGCALCHLTTGPGIGPLAAAPSCFSASHTNAENSVTSCHANGPLTAPHPVDGSYRIPTEHGKDAKQDLTICQNCHATPAASGPGSNPRFSVPRGTLASGCETCHRPFHAHPETWAGPNQANVFHYQSGNIANACALCHGAALDGSGGVNAAGGTPGQSCRECHAETTFFNLNCSACHGYPPDGVTAEPQVAALGGGLVNHGNVDAVALHDQCAVCHGVKSSNVSTSGHLSPNASYRTFDVLTGVPGDHWNGQINMNGPAVPATGVGYNAANFGCDSAGCHGNDAAHRLSDSALPVQYADYGVTAPHALDGSFLLPGNHGPVARADLTRCKTCHGQATTTNPRYNLGIISAGGNGCESCHNNNTAHPSFRAGGRENVHWYDGQWRHSNGTKSTFAGACSMCHPGIGGAGTIGPACTSCHRASPIVNNSGCISCHSLPPNGVSGIAGNARPNRAGEHSRSDHRTRISTTPLQTCSACHGTGFGPGNVNHFDQTSGADVIMTGAGAGMRATQTVTNTTCTGTCHGSESWY